MTRLEAFRQAYSNARESKGVEESALLALWAAFPGALGITLDPWPGSGWVARVDVTRDLAHIMGGLTSIGAAEALVERYDDNPAWLP